MPVRMEFGHARSACSCAQCRAACEVMPGFLVPADLPRLSGLRSLEYDPTDSSMIGELGLWARQHLLASPGAVAIQDGQPFRIPTLVPRKAFWGHCHWLVNSRCAVWEDAPVGCAMFSVCTTGSTDSLIARQALIAVMLDHEADGLYSRVWRMLWQDGYQAESPETGSRRLAIRERASKSDM